ncbi:DUF1189 domain-containing protein [Bacillus songklensis]|uniref:DUF1189 domain-containing protein n=1 Tax=Bacillus songklensis TaxID=1069116 RepID=A0ABV8AY79_9BACI
MNVYKQLLISLYSPKKMAVFRFQSIGKTMKYIFILTFISILPTSLFLGYGILKSADITQEMLTKEVPEFTISDGKLQTDPIKPIIKSDGNIVFIFDSSGKITSQTMDRYPYAVALLQNELAVTANHEPHLYSYSLFQGMDLSKQNILSYLNTLNNGLIVFVLLIIVGLYILAVGSRFIGITIFACIGMIFKNMLHRKMIYKQLWTIAAYSGTLTTLLFTVTKGLSFYLPGQAFFHWAVSGIFLFLAIKHIPAPKKQSHL